MLHQALPEFEFGIPGIDPVALTDAMWEFQHSQNAIGLAANQVGLNYRVFVMGDEEKIVCFNPSVVEETVSVVGPEGCLSFPGLALNVVRPDRVLAHFQTADGTRIEREFTGLLARCFCHETDHLNGVTFTERVSKLKLEMARKRMRK
jgi:peptide deformylase